MSFLSCAPQEALRVEFVPVAFDEAFLERTSIPSAALLDVFLQYLYTCRLNLAKLTVTTLTIKMDLSFFLESFLHKHFFFWSFEVSFCPEAQDEGTQGKKGKCIKKENEQLKGENIKTYIQHTLHTVYILYTCIYTV